MLRKPPRALARRVADEAAVRLRRRSAATRGRRLDESALLAAVGSTSVGELWERLASRSYPAVTTSADATRIAEACPEERERILRAAGDSVARRVDLLGSGPVELGRPIAWTTDSKSGESWPDGPAWSLDYAQLERPTDVKVPWELSRLHWLLPAAQAYLLTGDESYAAATRDVLEEWIDANPYPWTVNWAVAMEGAMRILSWTWLFHACGPSDAWRDEAFRSRFLTALFLHGEFVERNLERSDVNGNHYTADAAGLVFAGAFFGAGPSAERWSRRGWEILRDELPRQVGPDGVDFEASTAYHRLVTELFLLPALYRVRLGLPVETAYADRLAAAARFAATYSRPDGTAPLWGDADDARALPLGGQALNDHRYLAGVVAAAWDDETLRRLVSGPRDEALWLLGPDADVPETAVGEPGSALFPAGGVAVLRAGRDHVFVDCGPVGLAGRGGHGHNDCLAFEAVLDGVHLVSDAGSYVYTASREWRNRFRGTAFHSTPQLDGEELNRIPHPDHLWSLEYDARPAIERWESSSTRVLLRASHSGYERLAEPVRVVRTFALDPDAHVLAIADELLGEGEHEVRVPFQLAPGVEPASVESGRAELEASGRRFVLAWSDGWSGKLEEGWVSPSYGVKQAAPRLVLVRRGRLEPLLSVLTPAELDDPLGRASALLEDG